MDMIENPLKVHREDLSWYKLCLVITVKYILARVYYYETPLKSQTDCLVECGACGKGAIGWCESLIS